MSPQAEKIDSEEHGTVNFLVIVDHPTDRMHALANINHLIVEIIRFFYPRGYYILKSSMLK